MSPIQRILNERDAAGVKRWHTARMHQTQTVGAHSHGVAMLCSAFSDDKPSTALLMAALTHDLGEFATGDVPAHIKWKHPKLNQMLEELEVEYLDSLGLQKYHDALTIDELDILALADRVELILFLLDESRLGNSNADRIIEAIRKKVMAMRRPTPIADVFMRELDGILDEPTRRLNWRLM